jgi:hypothetical protein
MHNSISCFVLCAELRCYSSHPHAHNSAVQVDIPERVCRTQAVTDLLDCRSAPADDRLYCRVTGRSATYGCTAAGLTCDVVLLETPDTL